jgi:hypothetical protein
MEIPVDVRWRAVEPGSKRNVKHEKTDCVFVEIGGSSATGRRKAPSRIARFLKIEFRA